MPIPVFNHACGVDAYHAALIFHKFDMDKELLDER
jgi:hypothetical protein